MKWNGLKIGKNVILSAVVIIFILGFFSKTMVYYFLPKVSIYEVRKMAITNTVTMRGQLKAKEMIKVRFPENVLIDEMIVKNGASVKAGDPVFRVNPAFSMNQDGAQSESDLDLEILKIEEQLKQARMDSTTLMRKELELKREEIVALEKSLAEQRALFEIGATTEAFVDAVLSQMDAMRLNMARLESQIQTTESNQSITIKELESARDKLMTQRAILGYENGFYSMLKDHVYYAPANGVVIDPVSEQMVAAKDSVVLSIAPIENQDSFVFEGLIHISDLAYVSEGDLIELENESMEPIEGTIYEIGNIAKGDYVQIKATLNENAYNKLFIDLDMVGKIKKRVMSDLALPKSAIISGGRIKAGDVVSFYSVNRVKGLLGDEYIVSISKGSVGQVGDLYVSLNLFTLEGSTERIILNPSYKVKVGERVIWERE